MSASANGGLARTLAIQTTAPPSIELRGTPQADREMVKRSARQFRQRISAAAVPKQFGSKFQQSSAGSGSAVRISGDNNDDDDDDGNHNDASGTGRPFEANHQEESATTTRALAVETAIGTTTLAADELSIVSSPIVIASSTYSAHPSLISSRSSDGGGEEVNSQLASLSSATSTVSSASSTFTTTVYPINCWRARSSSSPQPLPFGAPTMVAGPSGLVANGVATIQGGGQWMMVAAQTTQGMRHRMSLASDQLGHSLRQLYTSASSITDVPPSYHNIPGIVPYYHGRTSGPPPSYDDVINPYAPPPTYQSLFGQMREARKTSRGLIDLLRRLLIILISTLGCTILIAFMILIPFTMIIVGAIYIDECRVEHIPAFLLVGGLVWASKNIIHCYAQCRQDQDPIELGAFSSGASTTGSGGSGVGIGDDNTDLSLELGLGVASGQGGDDLTAVAVGSGVDSSLASHLHQHNHQHHHHNQYQPYSTNRRQLQQQQRQQQYQQRGRRLKSSICESLLNCVLFGWFIAGCVIVFRNYEPDFDNPLSLRYCHRTVYMYTFWLITSAIIIFGLFIGCICCLMVSSAIASRQDDDLA